MNKSSQILETSKTCSHWTSIAPQAILRVGFLKPFGLPWVLWDEGPCLVSPWFCCGGSTQLVRLEKAPVSEARKSTCQLVVISRLWFQLVFKYSYFCFSPLSKDQVPRLHWNIFQLSWLKNSYRSMLYSCLVTNLLPGVFYYQACFETTGWGFTCGCPRLSCSQCHFSPLHCSTAWGGDVALLNDMGPGKFAEDSQL